MSKRPRLRTVAPRVRAAPSRIAPPPTTERLNGRRGTARRAAFLAANPLCADPFKLHPGIARATVTPDHVVPLFAGGADTWDNLQPLCAECHAHKTANEARERGAQS